MRKIFLLLFFMFWGTLVTHAISFNEGSYISNTYIKKVQGSVTKYLQLRFIYDSNGQLVYCLEPFLLLDVTGNNYLAVTNNYPANLNLSAETWERVMLLAYYGYGYLNHGDAKWYSVAQLLIWRTVAPQAQIYFTSTPNGAYVSRYEAEINEMESLVANHKLRPSFNKQKITLNLGERLELTDTNQVLNRYQLINNNNFSLNHTGNKLIIEGIKPMPSTPIYLQKTDKYYNKSVVAYTHAQNQNALSVGSFTPETEYIEVAVTASKINLNITNNKDKYSSEAKFLVTYGIYNYQHQLLEQVTMNQNGQYLSSYLPYGTYYVKQISSGVGYQKDLNQYQVILNSNSFKIVNLPNYLITNQIKITKYYGNDLYYQYELEEQATFNIYDYEHKLAATIITNEKGEASLELGYGQYYINQITGKQKHDLITEHSFIIKDANLFQDIKLYNNLFKNRAIVYLINEEGDLIDEDLIINIGTDYQIEEGIVLTDYLLDGIYPIELIGTLENYEIIDVPELMINENGEFEIIEGEKFIPVKIIARLKIIPPLIIEPEVSEKVDEVEEEFDEEAEIIAEVEEEEINDLELKNEVLTTKESIVNPKTSFDNNLIRLGLIAIVSIITFYLSLKGQKRLNLE